MQARAIYAEKAITRITNTITLRPLSFIGASDEKTVHLV